MPTAPPTNVLFFDNPFYWMACGLIIVAVVYGAIFFHELGHWLLGKMCGYRILGFSVGEGKMLWRGTIAGCFVHFRLLPVEGYVIAVKASGEETRWQQILLSAGGPLFSAILMGIAIVFHRAGDFRFLGDTWSVLASQMLSIVIVLLALDVVFNLWPRHANLGGTMTPNDGMSILTALRSERYPKPHWYLARLREAFDAAGPIDTGTATAPTETEGVAELFIESSVHCWDGRSMQAIDALQTALEIPHLSPEERAFLLGETARIALTRKACHARALECCEQAYALFPDNDHFACQLAFSQIHLRFYDRGRRLLDEVLERSRDNRARASALCTLALADAAQKKREDGLKRTREARKLFPCCPLLPLARAALLGGSPGFEGGQ